MTRVSAASSICGTWQFYTNNGGAWWTNDRTGNFGTNNGVFMPGARESSNGNPDVTWETATKQNYGADVHFFGDRLSLGVDLFWEDARTSSFPTKQPSRVFPLSSPIPSTLAVSRTMAMK